MHHVSTTYEILREGVLLSYDTRWSGHDKRWAVLISDELVELHIVNERVLVGEWGDFAKTHPGPAAPPTYISIHQQPQRTVRIISSRSSGSAAAAAE